MGSRDHPFSLDVVSLWVVDECGLLVPFVRQAQPQFPCFAASEGHCMCMTLCVCVCVCV